MSKRRQTALLFGAPVTGVMCKVNVLLRKFELGDMSSLLLHANNPNVARYLRDIFPSPYTEPDAKWWLSEGCNLPDTLVRAIDIDGECVGSIGITYPGGEHSHSVELGFWLGEEYWGQGIASQAVSKMTEIALNEPEICRVFAHVAGLNLPSMRVLEKCGYHCEGVLKRAVQLRGQILDEHIYAIHT